MEIFDALRCWIRWLAGMFYYYMVEAVEVVLDALALAVNAVLFLLPQVAFDEPDVDSGIVGALNYIVPVGYFVNMFGLIMVAWVVYRIYQWILKWGKAAD